MTDPQLRDEGGTVAPLLALLLFAAIVTLGLAVEIGRWGASWREAAFAADAGAQAGAAHLDESAAYRGILALDPTAARTTGIAAALDARPRSGRIATAVAGTDEVCVTVSQLFTPGVLRAAGIDDRTITATACARPYRG